MDEQNPQVHPGEEHYYGSYRGNVDKITPPPPAPGNRRLVKIMAVFLAVLLIIVAALTATVIHLAQQPAPVSSKTAFANASTPNEQPTSLIQPTEAPTMLPTPTATEPVPTSTPSLAGPETLQKNIRLKCDCTDRVLVTITQIVIQPDQDRMLWSMTFFNNSQQAADAGFGDGNFYLQEGDQINDPAPGEQKYDATGPVIGFNAITLRAGETQQVTITFSFVPYTGISYTLVSIMQMDCCGQETAHFDPVLFTF